MKFTMICIIFCVSSIIRCRLCQYLIYVKLVNQSYNQLEVYIVLTLFKLLDNYKWVSTTFYRKTKLWCSWKVSQTVQSVALAMLLYKYWRCMMSSTMLMMFLKMNCSDKVNILWKINSAFHKNKLNLTSMTKSQTITEILWDNENNQKKIIQRLMED